MCERCGFVPNQTPVVFAAVFYLGVTGAIGRHDGRQDCKALTIEEFKALPLVELCAMADLMATDLANVLRIIDARTGWGEDGESEGVPN